MAVFFDYLLGKLRIKDTGNINSLVAGANITIDLTDPANPVISTNARPITVVADYNSLPAANTVPDTFYWCSAKVTHTTLFITFTDYEDGLYYSNGTTWEWMDAPIAASQAEADAATDGVKYITARTANNLAKWNNYATLTGTETLTNKRITRRVTSIVSSATPTVNTDTTDFVRITALAVAITSMTTNLSGTPTEGQLLQYQILDNGTARAITWGASFEAKGQALPTTTTLGKRLNVLFSWDSVTSKWGCLDAIVET